MAETVDRKIGEATIRLAAIDVRRARRDHALRLMQRRVERSSRIGPVF